GDRTTCAWSDSNSRRWPAAICRYKP
ncbi:hypothetical protein ID866_3551, partial [Astraeus odoratus]